MLARVLGQTGLGHDGLEALDKPGILFGQGLELVVHVLAGGLVHQCLLFNSGKENHFKVVLLPFLIPFSPFHRVVDKVHVDVDGVDVGDAVLDPDLLTVQAGPPECLHGGLRLLGRVVLHQAPVLEHAVLLSNLRYSEISRGLESDKCGVNISVCKELTVIPRYWLILQ